MLIILGALVFLAAFGPSQAALADEYQNHERLDSQNGSDYMLYWTYNKTDSTISFAAKAKTGGWVGLGFTTKIDNTTEYDVVRGSYDSLEVVGQREKIYDFHTVGKERPVKDTQQNLMDKSVSEVNNSYTTIKFKRALDTQDSNDTVITPGPVIVVWSLGNLDVLESGIRAMGYKNVTFFPEDTTSTPTVPKTTAGPVGKAVACQGSWLFLALSALLFMEPLLRP